jgi:hypothetical protein
MQMAANFELYVKGKKVAMNRFVSDVVHDVVLSIVKNLHEIDLTEISRIEIS